MTIIRGKKNAFYLAFLFTVLALHPENGFSQGANIIPPSPNSSEFTKYIDLPVNEFTGIPNITIPLYEIIGKDINIPITLSYHASGVRVSQVSSSVGLGWSLNAGGVITRSVRGTPDDYYNENSIYHRGILHTNFDADSWMQEDITTKSLSAYLGVDMEPDVFYYNFNGNTGKFIFNKERQCTLIPKADYTVNYSMEVNGSITDFTVITDDGTEYFFSACETTIDNYPESKEFNSSWLLTRIKTQQETITFIYKDEKFSEESLNSELCYIDADGTAHKWHRFDFTPILTYNTKRISQILWSGGMVRFGEGVLRQDINQPDEQELLVYSIGNIAVYNYLGSKVKEYVLDYDYFNANCNLIFDKQYLCNRLRLESITEKADSKSLPPYEFTYNSTALPPRTSYEQDYWGFYNSNNATTFIPNIWAYPGDNNPSYLSHFSIFQRSNYDGQEYFINPGVDRSSNASAIQSGVLTKIKYPTGGFAEYTYEPHTFYFDGMNRVGGGIRVQKVKVKTNASTTAIEKEYKYVMSDNSSTSSGRIIRLPEFAYWRTNIVHSTNVTNIEEMRIATFITTGTLSSLEEAQGSYVAYKEITIVEANNGKTVKKFHLPATAEDIMEDCDPTCIYSRSSATSLLGIYICQPSSSYAYYYYKNIFGNYDHYPYPPNPNYDWRRGDISEESFFKDGDFSTPVKRIIYDYEIKSYEKIPAVRFGYIGFIYDGPLTECSQKYEQLGLTAPTISVYRHYKYGYYYNISAWKVLSTVKEYTYFGSDIVEEITTYDFNSPNHTLVTKKTINNSNQIDKIVEYVYPPDVTNPSIVHISPEVIDKMAEKNMINYVIKTEETVNNEKTEGTIYALDFNTNNESQIVPTSVYNLEGESYAEKVEYQFDTRGNPIEIHNINGLYTTYLWGYNYQYPVVKIENAEYSFVMSQLNILYSDLQTKTSEQLLSIFNTLRQKPEMSDKNVYSYTYDPLVGMTSETDPNGITTIYAYDDFGRLETIRDKDFNVLKHVDYNFGFNATLNNNPNYTHGEIVTFSLSVQGGSGSFSYSWNISANGQTITTGSENSITTQLTESGAYSINCVIVDNESGYSKTLSGEFEVLPIECKFINVVSEENYSSANLQSPLNEIVTMRITCSGNMHAVKVFVDNNAYSPVNGMVINAQINNSGYAAVRIEEGTGVGYVKITIESVQNNTTVIGGPNYLEFPKP